MGVGSHVRGRCASGVGRRVSFRQEVLYEYAIGKFF